MVVTGRPSDSQPHDEDQKPTEPQRPPPLQTPHSETLDTHKSPLHDQTSQQSDKDEEETLIIHDGDDQQSQLKHDQQSGSTHTAESIVPPPPPPPPLASPTNSRRRPNKRKKGGSRNNVKRSKWQTMKIQNLTEVLKPIPFVPKALDLHKHEDVLKRLGLYEFSKIEFDRSIRADLLVQLIVNYDSKKRCSYVNEKRISVNRADLARALKLPAVKQDKGSRKVEEVDLDSEVFSDEAIGFIEDFVFNWLLFHEESWIMPAEIVNWTRCIRDGHPEKLDLASLIWYKVEKELTQGDKLVDCYYASHLQYLIRSQHDQLFKEDDGGGGGGGIGGGVNEGEEAVNADEEQEEREERKEKEEQGKKEEHGEKEEHEEKDEHREKEHEEKDEHEEKVPIVQEDDVELTLGPDVEKVVHQEVREDDETMVDAEECKEEAVEEMEEQVHWKNALGEHILQRCQSGDLNDYEEVKIEEVEDEQIEQVEDEDDEVEEGGVGGRFVEGFDMEANDDSVDRDGLTDNFLQGVETSHIPYGSHGVSSMDIFRSRDDSFMSQGDPSFFDNGGKRVMEPEEDIHHLDGNRKRLKTDDMWDQKQNDFGFCMEQMQHWMEKAKMIHDSKEESYVNSKNYQDLAMNDLQERNQLLEMIIKSKDEELKKKHDDAFRLERELYLMEDLLAGYRKALNDTRFKFAEYRKRFALQEEPLYKDAGPGGLVLSTRELEKQRLKQEEDMMKLQTMAKSFEEECVYQLETQGVRALMMAEKLMVVENEVKRLKEIAAQRKETQKLELSAQPEENQKLLDGNEPSDEPEEKQKSLEEHELSLEPQENQESLEKQELPPEPEENQKSLEEHESSPEHEENQKSLDKHEVLPETEENQKPHNEVLEGDANASMEIDAPDADESKVG